MGWNNTIDRPWMLLEIKSIVLSTMSMKGGGSGSQNSKDWASRWVKWLWSGRQPCHGVQAVVPSAGHRWCHSHLRTLPATCRSLLGVLVLLQPALLPQCSTVSPPPRCSRYFYSQPPTPQLSGYFYSTTRTMHANSIKRWVNKNSVFFSVCSNG